MSTTTTTQRAEVAATTTTRVGKEPSYYVGQTIRYVLMILFTLIFLGPFIMALFGSFKSTSEVLAWPPTLLPHVWQPSNYADVWNALPDANGNSYFPRWALNSLILPRCL